MMTTLQLPPDLTVGTTKVEWNSFSGDRYECRALIRPEEEGGFSAVATRLPGVVSQGETQEEAIRNLADAFQGVISSYRADNQPVPWTDRDIPRTFACKELWIAVDVK